ncbi:MAG: NmrA/HSCARG family protein [Nitrospiraceae bacterium]|nr:NmrA/HSCARG family protein [Nitrospiraceae bacterium]
MKNRESIILVSGSTGKQGGAVARELLSHGYRVRAMTRKTGSRPAIELASLGAEVVRADLDDERTLTAALKGVWGVFAVQNTWEAGVEREEAQGKRLAEAAKRAGVEHFVYSSVGSAHRKTGIPHFENKFRIEETVRGLAFPSHVILRPVFFMENWISPQNRPALDAGRITMSMKPYVKLQMVAVEDIGRFGRMAFEKDKELNRREIDIAGDERTLIETAEILGKAIGRKIELAPVPLDEIRKQSEDYAVMLEWFDKIGYNADIAGLAKEFGFRLITLPEWAERRLAMPKAA